jgi:hypothetical protein
VPSKEVISICRHYRIPQEIRTTEKADKRHENDLWEHERSPHLNPTETIVVGISGHDAIFSQLVFDMHSFAFSQECNVGGRSGRDPERNKTKGKREYTLLESKRYIIRGKLLVDAESISRG